MSTDLLYEYFYPPSDYFRSTFDDVPTPEPSPQNVVGPSSFESSSFDSSFDLEFCIWKNETASQHQKVTTPSPKTLVMNSSASGNPSCHVCASPTANTLHFGGRSCKACAAFFRRSVAMSMTYECIGSGDDAVPCRIHFELRMLCRHCRFIKCLEAGMRRQLVQAKKEETRVAKRRSRGLIVAKKEANAEANYEEYVTTYTTIQGGSPLKTEPNSIELNTPDSYLSPSTSSSQQPLDMTIPCSLTPPPPAPTTPSDVLFVPPVVMVSAQRGITQSPPFDPQQASTSQGVSPHVQYYRASEFADQKIFELVDHYVRTEASLNDRRKIMYTDTQIRDVFDTTCECPYERHQLKPFNYKTFCGFVKHDFVMILDYVNQFPEFQSLLKNEKSVVYRMACAVDSMLASAYYTYRAGIDKEHLVLFNGDFIPMNPKPMSGTEVDARSHFESAGDHEKYKTLMPLKLKQYFDLAVPFSRLNVSFEEFVLLKALTIWHISNYNLLDEGRAICARQRDAIVQALHKVVEERGDEDPAIRVGQLLLSMSYITEQVQAMTSAYLLMTFFDVVACDSIVHDLLTFKDD